MMSIGMSIYIYTYVTHLGVGRAGWSWNIRSIAKLEHVEVWTDKMLLIVFYVFDIII